MAIGIAPGPVTAAPICGSVCAVSWGDPHLRTFDGAAYDGQLVGELVSTRSTTDDLQVQVRQQPWNGSRTVSVNVATAVAVSGHVVEIDLTPTGVASLLDGQPFSPGLTATPLPGGGSVILDTSSQERETIVWPDGSLVAADYVAGSHMSLTIGLAPSRAGHMQGLLGNADADPSNDYTARDGHVLPVPVTSVGDLLSGFAATWRVSAADSLFTYDAGQNTSTFTDVNFPYTQISVADLPAADREGASAACQAAGVTDPVVLSACILDVAVSGDANVAGAATTAQAVSVPSGQVIAASAVGDSWTDGSGVTGRAALTFGNGGCAALDANQRCTGGAWTVIDGAPWIWTGQFTTANQDTVTFTKTVTVTAAQAASPMTLTAAADNQFAATVNGTAVLSGGFNSPQSAPVVLTAGANTLSFTVSNDPGFDPGGNPAGLAWKLTRS